MKRFWQIGNILALAFALVGNYLVGASVLSLPQINDISEKYATLLTPAGYAFSIWSVIYVLLVVFVVYQARDLVRPNPDNDLPERIGPLFILASLCNGLWPYVFVTEWLGVSVLLLVALTAALYWCMWRLNIARYNPVVPIVACVWWPLLLYTGWVSVATIVNFASWLSYHGVMLSEFAVSLVIMALAAFLIVLLLERGVRELVLAATWGIVAVGVMQLQTDQAQSVAAITFSSAGLLLGAVMVHGYLNRHTNSFTRTLKRRRHS